MKAPAAETASFDEFFDTKAVEEFGDLGPADTGRSDDRGGGDRGAAAAVDAAAVAGDRSLTGTRPQPPHEARR